MNVPTYVTNVSEEDVEQLISQLQDESLLKMSVDNHSIKSNHSSKGQTTQYAVQQADDRGLQSDIASRYATLKARNSVRVSYVTGHPKKSENVRNSSSSFQLDRPEVTPESNDSDALSAELEARLRALKSPVETSPSVPDPLAQSTNPLVQNTGSAASNLLHQIRANSSSSGDESSSIGSIVASYQDQNDDDLESAVADVKKLLRSVRDEIRLKKEMRNKQKEDMQDCLIEEESDLLDVGLLEEEYVQASTEEDRLARAAEEVVRWAEDAVRLGDCENEEDLENDDHILDTPSTSPDTKPEKKKVKGWRLFK